MRCDLLRAYQGTVVLYTYVLHLHGDNYEISQKLIKTLALSSKAWKYHRRLTAPIYLFTPTNLPPLTHLPLAAAPILLLMCEISQFFRSQEGVGEGALTSIDVG